MIDFKAYSAEELRAMADGIKAELKGRRENGVEDLKAMKAERALRFTGNVKKGDNIRFFFNKKETEGVVVNDNEKTVTVSIEGKNKYIKYENVIEILAHAVEAVSAPVAEVEEEEDPAQSALEDWADDMEWAEGNEGEEEVAV